MSKILPISATSSSITVRVTDFPSNAYYIRFYIGTSTSSMPFHGYATVSGSTYTPYTFSGLAPDTTYFVKISVRNSSQAAIELPVTEPFKTTVEGRPSDWHWSSNVTKGAAIRYTRSGNTITCKPLTASEWNGFIDRIYEFLAYKGKSTSISASSLYVTSGTRMTATTTDKARSLIGLMTNSLPAAASSGGGITAAYINGLKDSLNSIT